METVTFDLSNVFSGENLIASAKELRKPMQSGIGKLVSVEKREKGVNPNVMFKFASIVDEDRTVVDFLRTSSPDNSLRSFNRLKYLALNAGKPELLKKVVQFLELVDTYDNAGEGSFKAMIDKHGEGVGGVFTKDFCSAMNVSEEVAKAQGWKEMLLFRVVNQEAICDAFVAIGEALVSSQYNITIEKNKESGYSQVKRYEQV
jgi:hypothetical protein